MARKGREALRRAEPTRHEAGRSDGDTVVLRGSGPVTPIGHARQHEYAQQHAAQFAEVPERLVASFRPHARVLFFPCLTLILLAAAAGYFGESFAESWQRTLFYGLIALGALLLWLLPLLAWLSRRYTVTTRRLVLMRGFFVRIRQELLHSRGYDISLSRGPVQSIFRSGDIRINTGLESPGRASRRSERHPGGACPARPDGRPAETRSPPAVSRRHPVGHPSPSPAPSRRAPGRSAPGRGGASASSEWRSRVGRSGRNNSLGLGHEDFCRWLWIPRRRARGRNGGARP